MRRGLSVELLLYSLMLVALSVVAHRYSTHSVVTILPIGIVGVLLSAILGVLGLLGYRMRRWPTMAMTILSISLLAHAVGSWLATKESGHGIKPASLIPTLLWLFAVGQLLNLIQEDRNLSKDGAWQYQGATPGDRHR